MLKPRPLNIPDTFTSTPNSFSTSTEPRRIVVTGQPGAAQRREIGNAVGVINASDIVATAPIIDAALPAGAAGARAVDPIPSALVVTAIVIGFSVTAVMLSYAIRLYAARKTLSIDAFTEQKW